MKILAFTDPHGDVQDARKVVETAARERPDLIVCAGDFSIFGNNWRGLFQTLFRMWRKIHVVGGNHESPHLMESLVHEFPFLVDVAYTTVEENGIMVGGLPGYDSDFWPSKRSCTTAVSMAHELWRGRTRSKPFVFLTHFPPAGAVDGLSVPTPDAGGSHTVAAIVRAIDPDLVVTGHYHQDFGCSGRIGGTRVVNPGPSGKMIHLDLASVPLDLP